jgi:hypothetical protein
MWICREVCLPDDFNDSYGVSPRILYITVTLESLCEDLRQKVS